MNRAAILALALGWLPLTAIAQTSGGNDGDRIQSAAERVEKSGASSGDNGFSRSEQDALSRVKAAGVTAPAVEALSRAAASPDYTPSYAPASRPTYEERPVVNETGRSPQTSGADERPDSATPDSAQSDDAKDKDSSQSNKAAVDTPAAADTGDSAAAKDATPADEKTADAQVNEGDGGAAEQTGPGILRVPRGRVIHTRDRKIRMPGEQTVEQPIENASGFTITSAGAKIVRLDALQPVDQRQSFTLAQPRKEKSGFDALPVRTAAIEPLPRARGGFEPVRQPGADRARPPAPKPETAVTPLLETP